MARRKILVKQGAHGPCPVEGGRRFIDETPVEVETTPYYLRALADGDLVEVTGPRAPAPPALEAEAMAVSPSDAISPDVQPTVRKRKD